jgi:hypothetical protein
MTHRAESIVVAVVAKVTGLTTTGTNVFRGRVYALADTSLPALCVYLGEDRILGQYSQAKFDSELTVNIEAVVKTSSTQVDTVLNQIREQVTIALQADYTQGLAYLLNTLEGDAAAPELSGDGEQQSAALKLEWKFHYRRARTDPGAS